MVWQDTIVWMLTACPVRQRGSEAFQQTRNLVQATYLHGVGLHVVGEHDLGGSGGLQRSNRLDTLASIGLHGNLGGCNGLDGSSDGSHGSECEERCSGGCGGGSASPGELRKSVAKWSGQSLLMVRSACPSGRVRTSFLAEDIHMRSVDRGDEGGDPRQQLGFILGPSGGARYPPLVVLLFLHHVFFSPISPSFFPLLWTGPYPQIWMGTTGGRRIPGETRTQPGGPSSPWVT